MIRTLFIGTSDFALPTLDMLMSKVEIEIVGVITQPDKPFGRKQIMTAPIVKQHILDKGYEINVFQPEKIKLVAQTILDQTTPDLIIVASYGQMIPNNMLEYPKYKCINIHASILPLLRGAVPMPMSILQGFTKTGVTIQIMEEKMDVGDIIASEEIDMAEDETTQSLTEKLGKVSSNLLEKIIKNWVNGEIKPTKQDDSKATFCYKADISKEKAIINNSHNSLHIDRAVRAFFPWPIAWQKLKTTSQSKLEEGIEASSQFGGKIFKIYKGKVVNDNFPHKKGLKIFKHHKSLLLRCDVGWYEILEAQLEGKKIMSGRDYLFLAQDTTTRVRAIIIHDNKILLIFRKKAGKEFFALPGGSVGVEESHSEALTREILEETNLKITADQQIYSYISEDNLSEHFVYTTKIESEKIDINMNGEEMQYNPAENYYEPRWINLTEINKINIDEKLKEYIKSNY